MPFSGPEFDDYRLVLIHSRTRHVLLENAPEAVRLPHVYVPRWTRPAHEITRFVRHKWQLEGIVLDILGDKPGGGNVILMEASGGNQPAASLGGCVWGGTSQLRADDLTPYEHGTVHQLVEQGRTDRGPFSRMGWLSDATDWVAEVTRVVAPPGSWTVEQWNASATATLLRFEDIRGVAYWMKAVDPNRSSEARTTATLSSLWPSFLPHVIGFHQEWNAWLMREEGTPLSSFPWNRATLEDVIRRLAELQKASSLYIERLLCDGCHDHRIPTLRTKVLETAPYLEETLRYQDMDMGPPMNATRFRRIVALACEAASRFEDLCIPDTLMHCDFSFENILISQRGTLFADWAQASVGNPFVTFEQFRLQLIQDHEGRPHLPRLSRLYSQAWSDRLPRRNIDSAFILLPLISATCTLCCRREFLIEEASDRRLSHSHARTLIRQLDRAAREMEDQLPVCA